MHTTGHQTNIIIVAYASNAEGKRLRSHLVRRLTCPLKLVSAEKEHSYICCSLEIGVIKDGTNSTKLINRHIKGVWLTPLIPYPLKIFINKLHVGSVVGLKEGKAKNLLILHL